MVQRYNLLAHILNSYFIHNSQVNFLFLISISLCNLKLHCVSKNCTRIIIHPIYISIYNIAFSFYELIPSVFANVTFYKKFCFTIGSDPCFFHEPFYCELSECLATVFLFEQNGKNVCLEIQY